MTSRDPELATPGPADLFPIGTAAIVHRLFRAPDGTIRIVVQGLSRIRIKEFTEEEPYLKARVEPAPETVEEGLEVEALTRNVRDQFAKIAELIPSVPRELVTTIVSLEDPLQVAYTISNYQRMELEQGQKILELDSVTAKLKLLLGLLTKELDVLQLGAKIQEEARSEIEKVQRSVFPARADEGDPEGARRDRRADRRDRRPAQEDRSREDARGGGRAGQARAGPAVQAALRQRRIRRDRAAIWIG